jgi:hypothetical protein
VPLYGAAPCVWGRGTTAIDGAHSSRAAVGATLLRLMRRYANHCSVCGSAGHKQPLHGEPLTRSEEAGRLVYDQDLSFAEAGRRVGVTRQAAHQGWRRYVRRRDLRL